MDQVILVKGWKKGANWSFPRGKINKDESDLDCAIREVYEETGYDVDAAGLVEPRDRAKYIDVAIQHQHIRLYVFRGVPIDTQFEARTRKEISKIEWWKLSDLPTLKKKKQQQEGRGEDLALNANKFYMVAPFLVPLKKWISQQKRLGKSSSTGHAQYPTDDGVGPLPLETNGVDSTGTLGASKDMERLLVGLRQPSSTSMINSAPAADPVQLAEQASVQLKNLLRVPTKNSTDIEAQNIAHDHVAASAKEGTFTQKSKAATLLALLKGGKPKGPVLEPHTPLEQITEPLSAPRSPKPQHAVVPRLPALPPPPIFQLDHYDNAPSYPNELAKPDTDLVEARDAQGQQASINAWNAFETTSEKQKDERKRMQNEQRAEGFSREEPTDIKGEPRLPVMNETWRQMKVHDNPDMLQADQRHVVNVFKRPVGGLSQPQQIKKDRPAQKRAASSMAPQPMAAPYQATSNVQVSNKSQYQDIYRLTIPAANKLPMPRLTSHSSSLLDLFKNGQRANITSTSKRGLHSPKRGTSLQAPTLATANDKIKDQAAQATSMVEISALAGPQSSTVLPSPQILGDPKPPQTAHRANLLDLFRTPSVTATASTPPSQMTLDVPTNFVELSAMPSPSHSRHTSKLEGDNERKVPGSPPSKPKNMQKRKLHTKHGSSPVSATVNGPLNVPQFEMIGRKVEASGRNSASAQHVKRSPVTILARPSNLKSNRPGQPEITEPDGQEGHSIGPKIAPPLGLNPHVNRTQEPKPFQPQILRRPAPSAEDNTPPQQAMVQSSPHPAPVEKRDSPSPLSASEHGPSSSRPAHKAALLSLFTQSSAPVTSPGASSRPDLSAFVSPVSTSMKSPITFPLPPTNRTNSNLATMYAADGNIVLPARKEPEVIEPGVGISRTSTGERKTPTRKATRDVDRSFLLGYLDGIAKKEGR
ncbi:MAG: hypothetical protein L6R40_001518 [Gallowayella cf. fulva]|nr:MAG: hypothetical protein L6R40_001518 [Xanthomendoza cf. fulva]